MTNTYTDIEMLLVFGCTAFICVLVSWVLLKNKDKELESLKERIPCLDSTIVELSAEITKLRKTEKDSNERIEELAQNYRAEKTNNTLLNANINILEKYNARNKKAVEFMVQQLNDLESTVQKIDENLARELLRLKKLEKQNESLKKYQRNYALAQRVLRSVHLRRGLHKLPKQFQNSLEKFFNNVKDA